MRRIWAGLLCAVIALAGTVACGVVSQTEPEYVVYFREAIWQNPPEVTRCGQSRSQWKVAIPSARRSS